MRIPSLDDREAFIPKVPNAFDYQMASEMINPEQALFEQLCALLFIDNANGQKLIELLTQKYIEPLMFDISHPSANNCAMFSEGKKQMIRELKQAALNHKTRMLHERDRPKPEPVKPQSSGGPAISF